MRGRRTRRTWRWGWCLLTCGGALSVVDGFSGTRPGRLDESRTSHRSVTPTRRPNGSSGQVVSWQRGGQGDVVVLGEEGRRLPPLRGSGRGSSTPSTAPRTSCGGGAPVWATPHRAARTTASPSWEWCPRLRSGAAGGSATGSRRVGLRRPGQPHRRLSRVSEVGEVGGRLGVLQRPHRLGGARRAWASSPGPAGSIWPWRSSGPTATSGATCS